MDRITLRQLSNDSDNDVYTKATPLTSADLDGNFLFLKAEIDGTNLQVTSNATGITELSNSTSALAVRVTALENAPAGNVDLTNYYTIAEVDALIPTVFSGNYDDLTNKPTIPTPFSGDYVDLTNKPTIPADINELTDADGLLGSGGASYTDADVDTHLNSSTASANTVLSWNGTDYAWVAQASGGGSGSYNQSLNTTDSVEFASVTTSDLTISGTGTTTIDGGSNIVLDAPNRVSTTAPFKLATMDTAARDAIIATNGDMIYNTDVNKFQGYANGAWVDLH